VSKPTLVITRLLVRTLYITRQYQERLYVGAGGAIAPPQT